jgi:hypothetical protein
MDSSSSLTLHPELSAERLNRECYCITLDRGALCEALEREVGDADFCAKFIRTRPHLFSNVSVFVSGEHLAETLRIVRAIEAVTRLPAYRNAVLSWAPELAHRDNGPLGVFMGYDFHLAGDGPKLIEVNTNAGGAFLNALMVRAQRACCPQVEKALTRSGNHDFDGAALRMFQNEWRLQRGTGTPRRIAIVDDRPKEQYLYPEFLLAQRFFERHGIEAEIVDATRLRYNHNQLLIDGRPIDFVYNRVVDFSLAFDEHEALRAAYADDAIVLTPNPHVHALFADKRNMTLLSDQDALRSWGLSSDMLTDLSRVPRTVLVTPANAQGLWEARKTMFFKPASGYGSKAVYRGDKLTKGVWAEITQGGYVAQDFADPGERMVKVDGSPELRKTDVRLYVYDGQVLLVAARLYLGQTTNFRTPGGGFAPAFAV